VFASGITASPGASPVVRLLAVAWPTCECGAGLFHWLAPPLCYTPPSL